MARKKTGRPRGRPPKKKKQEPEEEKKYQQPHSKMKVPGTTKNYKIRDKKRGGRVPGQKNLIPSERLSLLLETVIPHQVIKKLKNIRTQERKGNARHVIHASKDEKSQVPVAKNKKETETQVDELKENASLVRKEQLEKGDIVKGIEITHPSSAQSLLNHKDIEEDYIFSRNYYYKLLTQAGDVLDGCMTLANESEHPRCFEVAGQLLRVNMEITQRLVELQRDFKEILDERDKRNQETTINSENTNVLVATNDELMQLIKEKREKIKKDREET